MTATVTSLALHQGGELDVERARAILARCRSVDQARDIRDKARAIEVYQRAHIASREAQQDAAEIVLRAERRLGELIAETEKPKGGRPSKTHNATLGVSLADRGITLMQSSRWQRLARVPESDFEAHVAAVRARGERLTTASAVRLASEQPRSRPEPDDFHPMISLGILREALLAKIAAVTAEWPASAATLVPELLRDLAEEMERDHVG